MYTPKEHTLAMLAHYLHEIAYDRVSPEVILIRSDGMGTWAGMPRDRALTLLAAELSRFEVLGNAPYPPHR